MTSNMDVEIASNRTLITVTAAIPDIEMKIIKNPFYQEKIS